eukprot:6203309-Pleurochrysis_carterae.AAC.2
MSCTCAAATHLVGQLFVCFSCKLDQHFSERFLATLVLAAHRSCTQPPTRLIRSVSPIKLSVAFYASAPQSKGG